MSKDTPEVGDVWQSVESGVIFILTAKDKYFDNMWHSMANDGRTRIIEVYKHFFETSRYLGKSKANIDDLFKTENEE